jgi:putative DNA primase/helicase
MTESWWEYGAENDGLWTERTDVFIAKTIGETLTNSNVGHGADFPRGIQRLLMARLAIHELKEKRNVIPLRNGILCLDTGDFLDHNPDYHLRWQLPYDYNPMATCHPIEQWLLETQGGDRQRVQLLRAYLKAVVTGRTDLQRFLEIVGPGGTGKSTYANLAISLVGIENCHITELKRLENNRFETANIYGKRLVYITDSERYAGNVSVFKSLTGQDPLPYERKYKHAQSSFYADAMVILCANEPIVSADYTSGLSRRRLTVPFTHRVADKDRRVLLDLKRGEGDFIPYLPGLLNWVIALPDAEMKNLIVNTAESVPSLNDSKNETLLASNPLAEWLDARCVFVPGIRSQVGNAIKERVTKTEGGDTRSWEEYAWVDQWLYPNYRQYCDRSNIKPISLRRFSDLLIDLCQCQLNQEGIEKGRDRDGAFITGIALRSEAYADSPRPVSGEDSEPEAEAVAEVDDESPVEWRILTPPDRQSAETLLHLLKQAANVAEVRRIWFDPSRYSDAARQAVTTHLKSVEWGRSIVDQIFNDF